MEKNTIVLSCFPAIGRRWVIEHQENFDFSIINLEVDDYRWIYRKRTEDELLRIKELWDTTPHLLSGKGYINKIKDNTIKDINPNFPSNYIEEIQKYLGKVDIILTDFTESIRSTMKQNNIEYTLIYPSSDLYYEWLGRSYIQQTLKTQRFPLSLIQCNWENFINSCNEDTTTKKIVIYEPNKFLSNYIHSKYFIDAKKEV